MPNTTLNTLLTDVVSKNELSEAQLKSLRQLIWGDNYLSPDEADLLFKINDSVQTKPENWKDMFVNSLTTFLVRQTLPHGYIDAANAAWLMERIDHDGVLAIETEFELLMNVLHIAESVPERLEMYALRQVRSCVLEGRGYLADGRELSPGTIEARDVRILRRILYACGGDGGFGITRAEAELLFDLDEATRDQDNDESWQDLFVGAVANYLMTMGAPAAPDFDEARRRQDWLSSDQGIRWNLMSAFKAWRNQIDEGPVRSQFQDSQGRSSAEQIDPVEAGWLVERLNRDGVLSENEKALLAFLDRESPDVHASLRPLINAAA